jgi:hypothetical protein
LPTGLYCEGVIFWNRKNKINVSINNYIITLGENDMPLKPEIKKNWIEIQKKHNYPVNAIGVKIDGKDTATLKVWREEGIDQFVKK